VRELYDQTLREKEVPAALQTRIKNVVENQRSALEYLAHGIYERHGDGKGSNSYYPVANVATEFGGLFEHHLPGVAGNAPKVRDAIKARQPYEPGYEWLRHLVLLTNENKHRRLTPQARTETHRVRAETPGGGAVEWTPNTGQGGVTFGSGVSIGGVPVDPRTQRPVPSPTQTVTETIYVDWLFEDPQLSARATLETIQESLPRLVDDVVAALP
jgi:hypothetical protein